MYFSDLPYYDNFDMLLQCPCSTMASHVCNFTVRIISYSFSLCIFVNFALINAALWPRYGI